MHMFNDLWDQLFVFLFTVLLIEDAIALPLHVCAAEAVLGGFHIKAVPKTPAPHVASEAEEKMVAVLSADRAFVGGLKIGAVLINIVNILCGENDLIAVIAVLHVFAVVTLVHVLAVIEVVAGAILKIMALIFLKCMVLLQCFALFLAILICRIGAQVNRSDAHSVLLARELLVLKTKFLLAQSGAQKTVFAADAIAKETACVAV